MEDGGRHKLQKSSHCNVFISTLTLINSLIIYPLVMWMWVWLCMVIQLMEAHDHDYHYLPNELL